MGSSCGSRLWGETGDKCGEVELGLREGAAECVSVVRDWQARVQMMQGFTICSNQVHAWCCGVGYGGRWRCTVLCREGLVMCENLKGHAA